VVGVLFFAQAMAMGVRGTIGLLVKPWEAEFGWDRAAVSLTASVGFVVYGLAQALSGRWADRTGPRVIFVASVALLGVATAAVGSIVSLWQAYAVFGILIMVAVGGASSPTSAVAVARWFTSRRGLALGVVAGGSAAGQFVILPLMATLTEAVGWRVAFLWLGAGILPRCRWPGSSGTPTSGGSRSPSSSAA
jgi:MFS family permease